MTALESRMVLHAFMCNQFGHASMRRMLDRFDGLPKGFMEGNSSRFANALSHYLKPEKVTADDLDRYDENIISHSQSLGMTDDREKSWKPFQYLALLFTERYLDLYFKDSGSLIESLNKWKEKQNYKAPNIPDYTADDIQLLAFQSATGSGKTLLLHANILQYKHYLRENRQQHKLNKIILVTPDEGLSRQHLRELQASGIPAQLFSDHRETEVFSQRGAVVDVIDLHKLSEKKGIKRVALESFEENNLVLVDEGHLGTGGKVWREYRRQLARNGFTFEYSATFNQAVSGSTPEIKKLRDEYGKSILFDYSYKFFYGDGYGKDYHISNMQQTDDPDANNRYLVACLLMFYQQRKIYAEKGGQQWREYNLAPPLWVFLGKTVTGGKIAGEIETDVMRIINFLAWVLKERRRVEEIIGQLTSGNTRLLDATGTDIFSKSFPCIREMNPQAIYDGLHDTVFRGSGQLHIAHLTGTSEIQLSAGDVEPFAVINVGDASGLYTKLEAIENPPFSLSKSAFAQPLFDDVDNDNSPVNIAIGARKFAAGWNSWRVSTMGLMHVGTGEGPQIIQMFGRGVRLKGYDMTLKRHSAIADILPPDRDQLKLLETLNIFGLKANYMEQFKKYLEKGDIRVERVVYTLPVTKQRENTGDLKILKNDKAGKYPYSGKRPVLVDCSDEFGGKRPLTLDRYKYLQVIQSTVNQAGGNTPDRDEQKLEKRHLDLMNKQYIYHRVLEKKRRFSWHNMEITQGMVNSLLENENWYKLYIPPEKLESSHYGRVREWEDLAVDLITEYAHRRWRNKRSDWENQYNEAVPLDENNPNYISEYELAVGEKETKLRERIEQLIERMKNNDYSQGVNLPEVEISALAPDFHAYVPLLYASNRELVQITPAPLNEGEAGFVGFLEEVVKDSRPDFLRGKEIHLMRNMSRGKGVSFFNDYSFYPDFILWVTGADKQDILFIDPKGLVHYGDRTGTKVKLHTNIKAIETGIQKKSPDVFLHSYIWSNTEPWDIGAGEQMTVEKCHAKGIYLASQKVPELVKLLKHALTDSR